MAEKRNVIDDLIATLERNTRGSQIAIYTIAGIGLAVAIHKVRPISKFSRASDVPAHFIRTREVLRGRVVGCQPSAEGPRLLLDHSPLVRIPFWHSSKPPLPVQVWGVKLVGGNGVSWLQCVAVGQRAEIVPLSCSSDALVANVTLQLPVINPKIDSKGKKLQPLIENLNVGERLVELGLGVVDTEIAKVAPRVDLKWFWLPWVFLQRPGAELLQRAQSRARARRSGFWQETIPQSRLSLLYGYIKSALPSFSKKLPPSVI